jgi:hypothetical protein
MVIKKNKIPTVIGVIFLLAVVFGGVFLLKKAQIFKSKAGETAAPKDIRVANLTDTSATISWVTSSISAGFISWGKEENSLDNIENEGDLNQKFFTHSITLSGLSENTQYFYKINSEGEDFDNGGIPWQFLTGKALGQNQAPIPISGSVISTSGQPAKRALVYATVNGYVLSTLTSDSGNFVLQLGGIRTSDLSRYAEVNVEQTLVNISVQAEGGETASAQVFPRSANPIPPLVLGQVKDYRGLQPINEGQNPSVSVNLPVGEEESKFNISTPSAAPKQTTVILESLDEGEVVTSTTPQFFGKGPAGTTVTVTVNSEAPVSGTAKIGGNGSWSWTPPENLDPGAHSVTISWIDATGITRSLTRSFIVQAGELPAFVATPSATPTTTPGPTTTPRPSATPTPIPSATPRITPTIRPTSTPAPEVPVTGDLTPTLLFSIMGVMILVFSFSVWKMSET